MRAAHRAMFDAIQDGFLVCPQPRKWHQFYKKFESMRRHKKSALQLPKPAILTSWAGTNDFEKNCIFLLQLHVLEQDKCLTLALKYLNTLNARDWLFSHVSLQPEEKSFFDLVVEDARISEALVERFRQSGITEVPAESHSFKKTRLRRTFQEWFQIHRRQEE